MKAKKSRSGLDFEFKLSLIYERSSIIKEREEKYNIQFEFQIVM